MEWYHVEALIDSVNYFLNWNITAGNSWDHYINKGVRKYETKESLPNDIGQEAGNLHLFVPELAIFLDYGEAEDTFDEIFGIDASQSHID